MNKKTVALTKEQYNEIITTMTNGFSGFRPNQRVATALVIEANIGIRISDVIKLRLCDIIRDGDRYRLDIIEQKTNKKRTFTVPFQIYQYIENYCLKNNIPTDAKIFDITERAIQKQLKAVCDYLDISGVSTHSFRKFFATEIYKNNNYNIVLVQSLLQHSSSTTTQKYIGIEQRDIEKAIENHICLL
jgi:integrase